MVVQTPPRREFIPWVPYSMPHSDRFGGNSYSIFLQFPPISLPGSEAQEHPRTSSRGALPVG